MKSTKQNMSHHRLSTRHSLNESSQKTLTGFLLLALTSASLLIGPAAQASKQEYINAYMEANDMWTEAFAKQGKPYRAPGMIVYDGPAVMTGCGPVSSEAGPLYCPLDETLYINPRWGDFFRAKHRGAVVEPRYIVAHEVAHHIQRNMGLLGLKSGMALQARVENYYSVPVELHADCLAGVVMRRSQRIIPAGFMSNLMAAAASIGDDALQGKSARQMKPHMLSHGTSAQREASLKYGFNSGLSSACERVLRL